MLAIVYNHTLKNSYVISNVKDSIDSGKKVSIINIKKKQKKQKNQKTKKKSPPNILVTMGVCSLYTNISNNKDLEVVITTLKQKYIP